MRRFLVVILVLFSFSMAEATTASEQILTNYLDTLRNEPKALKQFLNNMPKGGDLHYHLSGGAYAEELLKLAEGEGFCVQMSDYRAYEDPNCAKDNLLDTVAKNPETRKMLIAAWSMKHFEGLSETGHDHFFKAIGKYSAIIYKHRAEVLADISDRSARQNQFYMEIMYTPGGNSSALLIDKIQDNDKLSAEQLRDSLLELGLVNLAHHVAEEVNQDEQARLDALRCNKPNPRPGCEVKVGYIYQVQREQSYAKVLAQMVMAFEAMQFSPFLVGANLVQPEDGKLSLQEYQKQMDMIHQAKVWYPNANLALHAGELSGDLVESKHMQSHIYDAVTHARASRIGHGADVLEEALSHPDIYQVMRNMGSTVEINLSSNFYILNTTPEHHPLPKYLEEQIPVVISTDDEAVSRTTITKEYYKAATLFNLDYVSLKHFSRNALHYAFLAGDSLWLDNNFERMQTVCSEDSVTSQNISDRCITFLRENPKAREQWALEVRFAVFEQDYGARIGKMPPIN